MTTEQKCPHCGAGVMHCHGESLMFYCLSVSKDGEAFNQSYECARSEAAQLRQQLADEKAKREVAEKERDAYKSRFVSENAENVSFQCGYSDLHAENETLRTRATTTAEALLKEADGVLASIQGTWEAHDITVHNCDSPEGTCDCVEREMKKAAALRAHGIEVEG